MSASTTDNTRATYKVGYLLIEDFSMMCISTMINPFRSANRELGYNAFSWEFLTVDDHTIMASDGFEAKPSLSINTTQIFDYFFVCSGIETDPDNRHKLNSALQRISKHSTVFGGLCTASFILARAGFLDDKDFTMHWENQSAFIEEFPELTPSTALYVIDGNLWTGSGGLSSMDMALMIINDTFGERVANAVGNQYQIDRIRQPNIEQRPFFLSDYETLPPKLNAAVKLMIENLERPLSITELSESIGITVRSLERKFKQYMNTSPAKHYRTMRLEKARHLLWQTNITILEVSILTGFPSPSCLSRLYQKEYGILPSKERQKSLTQ